MNLRRLLGRLAGRTRTPGPAQHLPQRLEEAIAYFAIRNSPFHHTRTAYLGEHTMLALLHSRLLIYLDTRCRDIAPHVMMFGIWEPGYTQLFQRLIRPGDTVLDLGANFGIYALLGAAATGPTGRVHAFEPNPRYADLAARSLAVNGFAGFATLHQLAVGAAEATTELHFSFEHGGGGHLGTTLVPRNPVLQAAPCRVVALDDLFPDPAFTADVVKMDVEGTEAAAVRGMAKLLARSPRVRVMFEFGPQLLLGHGSSPAELIGLLGDMGFHFWNIGGDAALQPVPAEELAARRDGLVNLLASRGDPTPA